jgi:hypothetical protein
MRFIVRWVLGVKLKEITPKFCTGIAKLTIPETGEVFEVSSDDLDWESDALILTGVWDQNFITLQQLFLIANRGTIR